MPWSQAGAAPASASGGPGSGTAGAAGAAATAADAPMTEGEVELDVRVVEGPRKGAVAADGALNGVRKERYQVE